MSEKAIATIPLTFNVPLNEITVTKDENGREYYNLPYRMVGTFGKHTAFLKGSRISIPKVIEDKPKVAKDDKPKLSTDELKALTG